MTTTVLLMRRQYAQINASGSSCSVPSWVMVDFSGFPASGSGQSAMTSGLFSLEMSNFEFGNSTREIVPFFRSSSESISSHSEFVYFHLLTFGGVMEYIVDGFFQLLKRYATCREVLQCKSVFDMLGSCGHAYNTMLHVHCWQSSLCRTYCM